ncbi:hypothetical protein [Ekhidna sp.]|uniref:hypothetical protein n=1 Tax=Ekhidna sp. TaxID=2608089 RepID=UPI003297A070
MKILHFVQDDILILIPLPFTQDEHSGNIPSNNYKMKRIEKLIERELKKVDYPMRRR